MTNVLRRSHIFFCLLSLFALYATTAAAPVPDLKINGLDGTVVLKQSDTMTLSVGMDSGGETANSDWWFILQAPFGFYLWNAGGVNQNIAPLYQGPIVSFPPVPLLQLPVSALPPGVYTFYFGVDTIGNGSLDFNSLAIDSSTLVIATPTAKGTPTGAATLQTIGPAGGTVSSSGITLIIPAGALSADTPISITPVTSMVEGGIGGVFRMEPDGLTFLKPALITMPFVDAELQGTDPDGLGIVFQDSAGYWYWMGDPHVDKTAKTVTIATSRFSHYSKGQKFQLRPSSAKVKVRNTLGLQLSRCVVQSIPTPVAPGESDPGPMPFYDCSAGRYSESNMPVVWSVSGNGTVKGHSFGKATYTAPDKKPTPDTETVTAVVSSGGRTVPMTSSIKIVDHLPWQGTSTVLNNFPTGLREYTATATFEYSSTFRSQLGTDWQIFKVKTGSMTTHFHPGSFSSCEFKDATTTFAIAPDDGKILIDPKNKKYEAYGFSGSNINFYQDVCCKDLPCVSAKEFAGFQWLISQKTGDLKETVTDGGQSLFSFAEKFTDAAGIQYDFAFSEKDEQ